MALGGGTFTAQNKVIPGAYINFVSAARASAELSERGVAAIALEFDWGPEKQVFSVEGGDFEKETRAVFGYLYYEDKLKGIRDLFRNARTVHFYRLNGGEKAANTYGTAKYSGTRGNDLKTVIRTNVDTPSMFDVITLIGGSMVDKQTVETAKELKENDFVVFKGEAVLQAEAGIAFTGGTNGDAVTGEDYLGFLDKIESYSFNTLGCLSTDSVVKGLFINYTKRMRDEMGVKFQTVVYDAGADFEGIINVKNSVLDEGEKESSMVYWTTGAGAGCAVNKTLTNAVYNGEFTVNTEFKQSELENFIKAGFFVFHKVGADIRVLEDVNSLTTYTEEKNRDFAENQVVRVLDQIGNDIAVLFNNKYLGKVQNNEAGRTSLWNDIAVYNRELEALSAIEDFSGDDVIVEKGMDKKSVTVSCAVTPVCSMTKLYMTVTVS